jgi:hypothetical protein
MGTDIHGNIDTILKEKHKQYHQLMIEKRSKRYETSENE